MLCWPEPSTTYGPRKCPFRRQVKQTLIAAAIAAVLIITANQPATAQSYPDGLYAEISTTKGLIVLSLDLQRTPMTVANFVGLAEGTIENDAFPLGRPFHDGSEFNRVEAGHVIAWGQADSEVSRNTGYRIPNEIHPELGHGRAGMLGMGNAGPHTASNSFYITLGDRSYLDGDYTVFGNVHLGMDVVMRIEVGDDVDSVTIVRVGPEATRFRPDDASFQEMVEAVWERVRATEAERARSDLQYVRNTWPRAESAAQGWQYVVLEEGQGSTPSPGQRISLRYMGHTPQGLNFASTRDGCGPSWQGSSSPAGQPCDFVVGESAVTEGLDAAIQRMRPGARWIVVVPSELGYPLPGYYAAERPGELRFHISPNTMLIYDVEIIG